MKRSYSDLADILEGMATSKRAWLAEHGPKRGEMDRLQRQRELEACAQVAEWLRRAAQRQENAA